MFEQLGRLTLRRRENQDEGRPFDERGEKSQRGANGRLARLACAEQHQTRVLGPQYGGLPGVRPQSRCCHNPWPVQAEGVRRQHAAFQDPPHRLLLPQIRRFDGAQGTLQGGRLVRHH